MKLVRFKENYSASINNRISYELVSDEIVYDENNEKCYDLKLIGYVPIRKLEEADENDYPAIDVFAMLSNM